MSEKSKGKYTNRSKLWEFANSAYILWAVGLLPLAAFIHIFLKTKYKKYLICVGIYIIPLILVFIDSKNKIFLDIYITSWLVGIVHCLIVRRGYLIRRELFLDKGLDKVKRDNLREKIKEEMNITEPDDNFALPDVSDAPKAENLTVIDINTCSEDELRSLPGVSVVQAKKAKAYRENQPFKSVDEFFSVAGIQPHFAVNIRPRVICSATDKPDEGQRGRLLDF